MEHRRWYRDYGWFAFTVNTERREPLLIKNIERLRASFRYCKNRHPFEIISMVVLPDHLHSIWQLPEGDTDYSKRWMIIKRQFSLGLEKGYINASKKKKREKGIWQRRFWEHHISTQRELINQINYIHNNPVKHGYVSSPYDWPYSSIHRDRPRTN